jgi:CRISPR-associated Csx14 family protein
MNSPQTPPTQSVFIATLGSEPQVVTAALDLLRRRRVDITRVIVLHTLSEDPRLSGALERLREALPGAPDLDVIFHPIQDQDGVPLEDVTSREGAEAAFRTMYRVVHDQKRRGGQIHLSIAGGRKTMAVFGMVTAQLLFDDRDCLWHLYSGGEFLARKGLHPTVQDEVHLIPIPLIQWSDVAPILMDLKDTADPFLALERQRELQLAEKLEKARIFIRGILSPAEERVVQTLVLSGNTDQEIAEELFLSPRTVEQHLRSAYAKAQDHWEITAVNRSVLITLLNLYYTTQNRGKPA